MVPDRREPTFHLPAWVSLPDFLQPQLAARNTTTVADLPYRIERVLHFSNGGGLYAGTDLRTGDAVVLKEARPHAGLAKDATDAVTRLRREHQTLQRLAGLDVVAGVRDLVVVGEHLFLVEDYVEGTPLNRLMVQRYPLTWRDGDERADERALAEYAAWALDVHARVERAVAALHERGVVIGDLHPYNVLVRPDGRVVLIDFEAATDVSDGQRPVLVNPDYAAPPDRTGVDVDHYALACLRLALFLPLTALVGLAPEKADQLAGVIADVFPVPHAFLAEAVRVIRGDRATPARPLPRLGPDRDGWRRARGSMSSAILASATPDRDDRLFPGDIRQFETGGLNIAHGAAGVLYALAVTGGGRHPEHEDWLVRRSIDPQPETRVGFYDGLHGVAYVLDHLGLGDRALQVLDICDREVRGRWERLGLDLRSGLAGIGCNLGHFATVTGDSALRARALHVADAVADRLGSEDDVATVSGGLYPHAGLLRGAAGPALMFIRLHEQFGDAGLRTRPPSRCGRIYGAA